MFSPACRKQSVIQSAAVLPITRPAAQAAPGRHRQPAFHRLVLSSQLGPIWANSLLAVEFKRELDESDAPVTCLTLCLADQSELIGILVDLHAHGLLLQSLNYVLAY